MNPDESKKLSWIPKTRISLRLSLFFFTILIVWIGWYVLRTQAQQACVKEIIESRGGVIYSHRYVDGKYTPNPPLPGPWFVRESLGLDYVDHVVVVDFSSKEIAKLPKLSRLPKLRSLWIRDTQISDLTPASSLTRLEKLWISDTKVTDLSPIAKCKNLKWLNASRTNIEDLSPLFELPNLEQLVIVEHKIPPDELQRFRLARPDCKIAE